MVLRRFIWFLGPAFMLVFSGWTMSGAVFGLSGWRGPMPDAWLNGMWVLLSLAILFKVVAGVMHLVQKRGSRELEDPEVSG
jgi:hypothetical protein